MMQTPQHAAVRATPAGHLRDASPGARRRSCGADPHPSRTVVLDPGPGHPDLLTILLRRAAQAHVRLEIAPHPTDASRLAAAFRAGAEAYVVASGSPDADFELVDRVCEGAPYTTAR